MNNHVQPLQALYFDRSGRLVSYHVNCYAGGFPNLKWNHDDAFSSFPPASVSPLDTLVSLQDLLPHVKTPAGETPTCQSSPVDYTVVVMWPVFMGRQSKRLIKTVKKNLESATLLLYGAAMQGNTAAMKELEDMADTSAERAKNAVLFGLRLDGADRAAMRTALKQAAVVPEREKDGYICDVYKGGKLIPGADQMAMCYGPGERQPLAFVSIDYPAPTPPSGNGSGKWRSNFKGKAKPSCRKWGYWNRASR